MSKEKVLNKREFVNLLLDNGFYFLRRGKGDHSLYTNGSYKVVVSNPPNRMVVRRTCKELGIQI